MHQPPRTGSLVQIVYILRAEEETVAQLPLQLSQRNMRRIGLGLRALHAPFGVKLPHSPKIVFQRFGSAYILNAMSGP
jgi:hypothetical protein